MHHSNMIFCTNLLFSVSNTHRRCEEKIRKNNTMRITKHLHLYWSFLRLYDYLGLHIAAVPNILYVGAVFVLFFGALSPVYYNYLSIKLQNIL